MENLEAASLAPSLPENVFEIKIRTEFQPVYKYGANYKVRVKPVKASLESFF